MPRESKATLRIKALLHHRHPAPEWLCFEELSDGTDGRRIDFFAINMWKSGWIGKKVPRAVAYEIKVSRSDFMHEINDPSKRASAEKLASECWFATPANLIKSDEVPSNWGLLAFGPKSVRQMKAAKQKKQQWNWSFICTLLKKCPSDGPPEGWDRKLWLYAGRELDRKDLKVLALKAFRADMSEGQIRLEEINRITESKNYKEMLQLSSMVWKETGCKDAAGFSAWLKENRSLSPAKMRALKGAKQNIDFLLKDER